MSYLALTRALRDSLVFKPNLYEVMVRPRATLKITEVAKNRKIKKRNDIETKDLWSLSVLLLDPCLCKSTSSKSQYF